ncbi:MAG TPA: hypothetical protein PK961_11220 [bacterium]|nr:hypothetical protein [bacterium]
MSDVDDSDQVNISIELTKHFLERGFAQSTVVNKVLYKNGAFKVTGIIDESYTASTGLQVVVGDLEDDLSYDESRIEHILNGLEGFHRIYCLPDKKAIQCLVFNHPQFAKNSLAENFQIIQSILKRTFSRASYIQSNKTIKFSDPFFKSLGLAETTMKLVGTDLYIRLDFEQEIHMTKGDDEIDK